MNECVLILSNNIAQGPMPKNETHVANDFYGFLSNFYQIFPEMLSKDLYIFGESYAGMPYSYARLFVVVVSDS